MDYKTILERYGIRQFHGPDYWEWGLRQLGKKNAMKIDRLRKPLQRGDPTRRELLAFYEFVAQPSIAGIVHSIKADAIRASGEAVLSHLDDSPKSVLDVGCNIGYLSVWLSKTLPQTEVLGIDISPSSIETAKTMAKKLEATDVTFVAGDPRTELKGKIFDSVIDCQTLLDANESGELIRTVCELLDSRGKLISVSPIRSETALRLFCENLEANNVRVQQLLMVPFSDCGEYGVYTLIYGEKNGEQSDVDINRYIKRLADNVAIHKSISREVDQ